MSTWRVDGSVRPATGPPPPPRSGPVVAPPSRRAPVCRRRRARPAGRRPQPGAPRWRGQRPRDPCRRAQRPPAAPGPKTASSPLRSPASGASGSHAPCVRRSARMASRNARQPAHMLKWRRRTARRIVAPRAAAICSRNSAHDMSRAARPSASAVRACNTSDSTCAGEQPRVAAMSAWERSPSCVQDERGALVFREARHVRERARAARRAS